ncbi:hypothetical protein [Ralstonia phage P-PSG-11-1]|uniref:Uncharacterized protein n=1 Tax=Ralstonia phage P-PSG-11 TaxID=2652430 RepID=A0A5P8D5W1_9CAUD|nr:hypothetical protein [Ralstonia phage P-PSG-11]QFP93727.1 hypothetical protein [Ralstonia phage P-PSG-11-1]
MATKTQTDRAKDGQDFFQLPAYKDTPTVTVNGTVRARTTVPSGVQLATPAAQDDIVAITFNSADPGNTRREVFTPATGATITPTEFCIEARIVPAGTIAALTITFPPNPSKEGQQFRAVTTQAITAVTWTGGARLNAPTTLTAGQAVTFEWSVAKQEWVRIN